MRNNIRPAIRCLGIILCLLLLSAAAVRAQDSREIVAAVTAASAPETIQQRESPDGSQRAQVMVYPCTDVGGGQEYSYERLDLFDTATEGVRPIAEQVINCGGLGAYGLWVFRWSENGAFLYYTDAREGTPDGFVGGWAAPIWRAHMADLLSENLGQAQFSPDGQWLARWDQTRIGIMPLEASEATDFALLPAGLQVLNVVWLPDSSGLVYIQADVPIQSSRSALTHIDLATMTQSLLLDTGR